MKVDWARRLADWKKYDDVKEMERQRRSFLLQPLPDMAAPQFEQIGSCEMSERFLRCVRRGEKSWTRLFRQHCDRTGFDCLQARGTRRGLICVRIVNVESAV